MVAPTKAEAAALVRRLNAHARSYDWERQSKFRSVLNDNGEREIHYQNLRDGKWLFWGFAADAIERERIIDAQNAENEGGKEL